MYPYTLKTGDKRNKDVGNNEEAQRKKRRMETRVQEENIRSEIDLELEDTNDDLKIKWNRVEHFLTYLPIIERSDGEKFWEAKTKNNEQLFPRNVYGWRNGEEISVQLFAFDQTGEIHAVTEKLQYVIGNPIVFTWNTVEDATLYHLIVKDDMMSKIIFEKEVEATELTKEEFQDVKVKKSEELRIGRTCMTQVIVYEGDRKFESEWKRHLIGGDLVPRNVVARVNAANPQRSIQLSFEAPKLGVPDEYKIWPIPISKIHKDGQICNDGPIIVDYLRQGTKYCFQVSARHGDKWSDLSSSNFLTTQTREEQICKQAPHGVVSVHLEYFTIGGTSTSVPKEPEFGRVRDIKSSIDTKEDKDVLNLEWKIPTFDNNAFDYKVENYELDIRKISSNSVKKINVDFIKGKRKYCINGHDLDLGETYEISISTIYIDIDKDEAYVSNPAKVTVVARPCQPKIIVNKISDERLHLSWEHAKGANYYALSLFTDDSDDPLSEVKVHQETIYERHFDGSFGFGKTYYVVITSIGSEGKANSTKTRNVFIGEDRVPRELKANISLTDPSSQIYLKWKSSKKVPISYEVMFSNGSKCEATFKGKTECVVTGLNAASYYSFKVVAIHKDVEGKEKRSGGCLSKRIATSSKPTLIQNVRTEQGLNPCTSVFVEWDKVRTNGDEEVLYRVIVMTLNEKIIKETKVTNTREEIKGLRPNTLYFTTVAAGNSEESGKSSAKLLFKTAFGKPERVDLVNNEHASSTTLILRLTKLDEKSLKYLGRLYNGEISVLPPCEIRDGHVFEGLNANTKYTAEVYAVFENGEEGTRVKSNVVETAPGKPEIANYGCCNENGEFSSRELFLKWKPDSNLFHYEVQVFFEKNNEIEKRIILNNVTEMTYTCQHESCQYSVQVRAKYKVFGDWSDKMYIELGPSPLKNIRAELAEESNNINIHCNKSTQKSLLYCMQALCNGVNEGKIEKKNHQAVDDDIVTFCYLPQKSAKRYSFQLWAEMPGINGKKALSNIVTSRPEKIKCVLIMTPEENPDRKITICWDTAKRCSMYELSINPINSRTPECLTRVRNTLTYEHILCQPEEGYIVFVRGLCESTHGEWSEGATVYLEPAHLENITAVLDEQSNDFIIQCKKLRKGPLSYCMQALCDGVDEGEVVRKNHESVEGDIIKFNYTPQKFAKKYSFLLWGEKPNNTVGKSAYSNSVISKPDRIASHQANQTEVNARSKLNDFNLIQRITSANGSKNTSHWVRNKAGLLIQRGKTITTPYENQSEPDIKYLSVSNKKATDQNVMDLAEKLKLSYSSQKFVVEFCNCDITAALLNKFLKEIEGAKNKITTLIVSYMDNTEEKLLNEICSILRKCVVRNLSLEYVKLNEKAVDNLRECLKTKRVDSLRKLDISYIKTIGPAAYKQIGKIMHENGIGSLNATDCDVSDDKLRELIEGLEDYQIEELDISCNTNKTKELFQTLANFVRRKGVKCLKLRGCSLTKADIDQLSMLLPDRNEQLLEELDLSYNSTIEAESSIGSLIAKCGLKKLSMAGCKLSRAHLKNMRQLLHKTLDTVSMRDNSTIGTGMTEVAHFVKECRLDELNISNCMLSARELRSFKTALGGAQLRCLHLGDRKREPDDSYIKEVCELLGNVEDVFNLQCHKLSDISRSLLRDQCGTALVKVKFSDGSAEEWKNVATL